MRRVIICPRLRSRRTGAVVSAAIDPLIAAHAEADAKVVHTKPSGQHVVKMPPASIRELVRLLKRVFDIDSEHCPLLAGGVP